MVERYDIRVGMLLHLCQTVPNEIACCTILLDRSNGCCIAFVENGVQFDGAIVQIMIVNPPYHENRIMWRLYHHNCGHAIVEIVELMNQNN